jgi:hypothetical protein
MRGEGFFFGIRKDRRRHAQCGVPSGKTLVMFWFVGAILGPGLFWDVLGHLGLLSERFGTILHCLGAPWSSLSYSGRS